MNPAITTPAPAPSTASLLPLRAPKAPQIWMAHPTVTSLLVGLARAGYPASLYEVTDRDGERLSLHTTIEAAESAADDLWSREGYELHDELDGSTAYVGSEFDGESFVGITFGFVREVER